MGAGQMYHRDFRQASWTLSSGRSQDQKAHLPFLQGDAQPFVRLRLFLADCVHLVWLPMLLGQELSVLKDIMKPS